MGRQSFGAACDTLTRRAPSCPRMAAAPSRGALVAAFASVYVIWGSTYLAIRFAVADMPPFLMAGARWLFAGIGLLAWRLAATRERPTWREWRGAGIVGLLLVVGGNGLVSFAEIVVPSSLAALLVAIVPMWVALFGWGLTGRAPGWRVALGVAFGVAGVALLVGPAALDALRGGSTLLVGIGIVLGATLAWSAGSLYSRRAPLPKDALLGAAMEMVVGGVALALLGLATGEAPRVDLAAVTWRGWASLAFLALFGSIVAYSAYVWLLKVARPELVATYAFVNPVVAVMLGVALAGETFTPLTGAAAALIVVAVALVVTAPKPQAPPAPVDA